MEDKKVNLLYFKAMIKFLEKWFNEGKCDCDGIETLLSSMNLSWHEEKKPFDQALWDDWMDSIEKVLKKESDNK